MCVCVMKPKHDHTHTHAHSLPCLGDSAVSPRGPTQMRKLLLALRPRTTTWTESQASAWKLLPQAVMKANPPPPPPLLLLLLLLFSSALLQVKTWGRGSGRVRNWQTRRFGRVSTPPSPWHSTAAGRSEAGDEPPCRCRWSPRSPVPSDRPPRAAFWSRILSA